jgi:hypothetical protein
VDKLYLHRLNHCITGIANVTTQQMLVHLYTTYGRLTPADVQHNDAAMNQPPYHPNKSIKTSLPSNRTNSSSDRANTLSDQRPRQFPPNKTTAGHTARPSLEITQAKVALVQKKANKGKPLDKTTWVDPNEGKS